MPQKRKGATAEDEIEAPPAKIIKDTEEVVEPQTQVCTMTQREYYWNVLPAVDECLDMTTLPDDLPKDIFKHTGEFLDFYDHSMEEYKEALKAGYDAYFMDKIASGKKINSDEWWEIVKWRGKRKK